MKEDYYFPHFSNARSDEKIIDMMMDLGWEGYGIYWGIIEMLRKTDAFAMHLQCKRIAFALQTDCNLIEKVICNYDLFLIEDDMFRSKCLSNSMREKKTLSETRRTAAKNRWKNKDIDANAMQMQCKSNANAMQLLCKERKGKEKKGKEKKQKKENTSPQSIAIATNIFEQLKAIKPDRRDIREESIPKWAVDIDRIKTIDNKSWEVIEQLVSWLFCNYHPQDKFDWRNNIRSGAKLRKHFDILQIQMNRHSGNASSQVDCLPAHMTSEINTDGLYD